jgi:hypothetical protein
MAAPLDAHNNRVLRDPYPDYIRVRLKRNTKLCALLLPFMLSELV